MPWERMRAIERGGGMAGSRKTALLSWGPAILFNVMLPILTYSLLSGNGMSTVAALTISALWPAAELVLIYALHHRIDEFGVIALVYVGLTVATSVSFNSAHLVIIKDSALTGVVGIISLASLALSRPLMFYIGRKFATDGTPEGVAYWNGLWQYPTFRHSQRVITTVWGLALVAEAGVRIALSYPLSTSDMVLVNSVLPAVATAGLVAWTITYGKRVRKASGADRLTAVGA